MKLITANKLNRFWQKGIKPIKTLLGTTDISKIGNGTVTGAINELNTGMKLTEVKWGDHLRIAYNADYACIYTCGIAYVSELRNVNSNVKPNFSVYVPCLYKSPDEKWYHGIVRYDGRFLIQFFDIYPDDSALETTEGRIVFTMAFKRAVV